MVEKRVTEALVTEFDDYYAETASKVTQYELDTGESDLIGVSEHKELEMGYQLLFRDGTRS